MIFIKNGQVKAKTHGDQKSGASVREYPIELKDHDFAIAHIMGRFPETGCKRNKVSTMTAYVIGGRGSITVNQKVYRLNVGDLIKIDAGERYFWQGGPFLNMCLVCSPPWRPELCDQVA
jgi:quercetin dioxygenase-like cupin family protein